jgi:Archaeal holliday junction resolvase (hjc)
MPSPEHDQLTRLGAKWLKRQGFSVVATEITAAGSREQPDVIGFRSQCSALIEVKVSRTDFFADFKKPERNIDVKGLGVYRFYLCPDGLIQPSDLPPRWGLLYARGRTVLEINRPKGNVWPAFGASIGNWSDYQHEPCTRKERAVLFSIARRLSSGVSV